MTILHESPECYVQQCSKCGAVFKYSLCDIHIDGIPHYKANGECIGVACFDSICCPCCETILPATKEWFYDNWKI